ncbi:hypothetical protein K456DRAFT_212981 [Colletotrichum gloeosporioides 23]|nr:hypothetical protein K456DRAFT_212981 [Colletotrichum gloeosporioides 23]
MVHLHHTHLPAAPSTETLCHIPSLLLVRGRLTAIDTPHCKCSKPNSKVHSRLPRIPLRSLAGFHRPPAGIGQPANHSQQARHRPLTSCLSSSKHISRYPSPSAEVFGLRTVWRSVPYPTDTPYRCPRHVPRTHDFPFFYLIVPHRHPPTETDHNCILHTVMGLPQPPPYSKSRNCRSIPSRLLALSPTSFHICRHQPFYPHAFTRPHLRFDSRPSRSANNDCPYANYSLQLSHIFARYGCLDGSQQGAAGKGT